MSALEDAMFSSELEYFRRRAREERDRAATAPNAIVAEVHRALAERYEALARQPEIREALSQLWRSRELPEPAPVDETAPEHISTPEPSQVPLTGATGEVAPSKNDSGA